MNFNRNFLFLMFSMALLIVFSSLPIALVVNAAKYAQVGREILENRDWINLTIGGDAYDQKPPLLFWIGAAAFKLFGISIYTFKISVILVSAVGIYSTFKLGQLLYDRITGLLAAIFWTTCIGYLHFHNDIHTDTLLATVVVFSVWMLTLYFKSKKWHHFLFGVIGIGLAMLTKGPVGLAIPAFAIGSDLLLKKKFKEIFHFRWLIGGLVIFIVITPALIGLINQFGLEGIKFYFWTNNMGRITGSYAGGNTDPTFYIHNSLYVLAPWTFLAFAGIILEIVNLFKRKIKNDGKFEVINLGAIILYLSILSVARAKNPHYMLGVVPFMFILAAKWSQKIYSNINFSGLKKILSVMNKVIAILLLLIGIIFPFYVFPEDKIIYWFVAGSLFSACCYLLIKKSDLKRQIIMLGLSGTFLMFTLNVNMLPHMLQYQTSIHASEDFNKEAPQDATLNIYKPRARLWELFLYSKSPGKYLVTREDLENFLPKPGAWIYTDDEGFSEMKEMNLDMTLIESYPHHKSLTRQSIKFLNPNTRKQHFEQMHLVRLD